MKSIIAISALILASLNLSSQTVVLTAVDSAEITLAQLQANYTAAVNYAVKTSSEVKEAKKLLDEATATFHMHFMPEKKVQTPQAEKASEAMESASKHYFEVLYGVPAVAAAKKDLASARQEFAKL